jgi:PEP-CTERM motif
MNLQRTLCQALAPSLFLSQACLAAPPLVTNGDFSSTITGQHNGTLNGKPDFLPGATGWQITPSYNAGVQDGALVFSANVPLPARGIGANIATQSFFDLAAGQYTLAFDYKFVGKDPYVVGDGLTASFGGSTHTFNWVPDSGWQHSFLRPMPFSGGVAYLSFRTTLGPKGMFMNVLPDPTAKLYIDNVTLTKYPSAPTAPVDEPATVLLLGAGLGLLGFLAHRRKSS